MAKSSAPLPRAGRGEVFSINFLRGEIVPLRVRKVVLTGALLFLVSQAAIAAALVGMGGYARQQWHEIQAGLRGEAPTRDGLLQGMEMLTHDVDARVEQLQSVAALYTQRFAVGPKLAALTKTLPPRTWITRISGSRDGRMMKLAALYLVDPAQPYELPAKAWIDALKADPSFGRGLKRLDLGNSSRKAQGKSDLFSFELVAEWSK